MNDKLYTVDELANKVNEIMASSLNKNDKRYTLLTKRRILDYTTKDLMSKPLKIKGKNYYTDEHVKQLVDLRDLQINAGMSDKTIAKAVVTGSLRSVDTKDIGKRDITIINSEKLNYTNESNNDLKLKAMSLINSFQEKSSFIEKNNENTLSSKVLRNIGSQYISSSIDSKGAVVTPQSVTNTISSLEENKNWNDGLFQIVNSQRNESSKKCLELRSQYEKSHYVFEPEDGVKVIVESNYRISDEKKLREFFEKFQEAFKKITDGS